MRIPSGVTDQFIYFVAVDSTDFATRETGLTGFTVYYSRDGGTATQDTTPTINETDATNMPGVYEYQVTESTTIAAGNDSEEYVVHITATGMAPVTRTIELYRPKITAGNTLGVASDGDISGNVDGSVASVVAGVTASTVSDKTGYSISGTKTTLDALNDIAATDVVSAGAITTLSGAVVNVDTVDTCINNNDMRGTDGANTTTPPTAGAIADQVWDELQSAHTTAGSFGEIATEIASILADTNELQTDDVPGLIAALNDLSAAQINAEMVDVLSTDTFAEPTGVPSATTTLATKIGYLYMALRNRVDVTATKKTFYDDGGVAEFEKDLSDDGTTYSESEANAI